MILFAADEVCLHYPGRPAPSVRNMTLTIHKGESLRLTGPSGAGKTSVMRLIAGLERPTTGRIAALPRRIGIAFAEPRLLPRLSVMENLLFVVPQAAAEAARMLDALDMESHRDSPAVSLSKGQAQRVALVRALIGHPEILLLDEALGGLDTATWRLARDLVQRRRAEDGFALVEISHDPARLFMPDAHAVPLARPNQVSRSQMTS